MSATTRRFMYCPAFSVTRPRLTQPMVTVRSERTAVSASPVSPFIPLLMSTLITRAPEALISSTALRQGSRRLPWKPVPSRQSTMVSQSAKAPGA